MENTDLINTPNSEGNSSTLQTKFWDFIKPTYHLQATKFLRSVCLVRDFLLNFIVGLIILAIVFLNPLTSYKITDINIWPQTFSIEFLFPYISSLFSLLFIFLCIAISIFFIGELIRLGLAYSKEKIEYLIDLLILERLQPLILLCIKKMESIQKNRKNILLKKIISYYERRMKNLNNFCTRLKKHHRKNISNTEYLFFSRITKEKSIKDRIIIIAFFIASILFPIYYTIRTNTKYVYFLSTIIIINIAINILTIDKKHPANFYISFLSTFFFFTVFFEFITENIERIRF